jgi:hypothetical protein
MALAVLVAVLAVLTSSGSHGRAQAAAAAHAARTSAATKQATVGAAKPGEVRAGGQLVLPHAGSSLAVFTRRPVEAVQVPVVKVAAGGLWIGSAEAQVFVKSDHVPAGVAPGRTVDVTGWMVPVTAGDRGIAGGGDDAARLDAQHRLIDADHVTLH